jgi:hypothetical protein
MSHEYNNKTAGGSACTYSNLASYNANYAMGVPPMGKPMSGKYVVPTYSPISYDALTGKGPSSCSGYFTIEGAYGKGAGSCQQTYTTSLCNQ